MVKSFRRTGIVQRYKYYPSSGCSEYCFNVSDICSDDWCGCAGVCGPSPTPLPTSTPTPTPIIRPHLCVLETISGSIVSPSQSVTITSTSNFPVTKFMYAFYNLDNLYSTPAPGGLPNPKGIYFGGVPYTRVETVPVPTNTHSIQVNFADINRPDENWGNQYPVNIQVNAYFIDSYGQLSWPEISCVVSFSVVAIPPTATISGSNSVYVCRDQTYTSSPSNATSSKIWAGKGDYSDWSPLSCSTEMGGTKWCRVGNESISATEAWPYNRTWTAPAASGNYYVMTNAYTAIDNCSGNPFCTFGGATCEAGANCVDCSSFTSDNCATGNGDSIRVTANACNPASPTNLIPTGNLTCSNTPTANLTLLWNADPAYSSVSNMWYDVRVSDGIAGQSAWGPGGRGNECGTSEDICINQWNTNSMNITVTTGKTYSFWVHDSGACCTPSVSTGTTFTVPACPPTINSLQVNEYTSGQSLPFSSTYGLSGRINTDTDTSGSGSNWLNPLKIVLNAQAFGGNTINQYYVGFYDKAGGLANVNTLDLSGGNAHVGDIQSRINSNAKNGFLLRYDSSTGSYYTWYASLWKPIDPVNGFDIKDSLGNLLLNVYQAKTGYPVNSWGVRFWRFFGSKPMYTAVEVIDSAGISSGIIPNYTPVP